jgi:hypothetical protein
MQVQQVQVTQHELHEIFDLERDVAPKLKRIEELKSGVKVLLIHKMPVELGRFDASLITRHVRNPTWKQCVVDNLGVDFAEAYRKRFPLRMFCDVHVEEHAVLPLWNPGREDSDNTDAGSKG